MVAHRAYAFVRSPPVYRFAAGFRGSHTGAVRRGGCLASGLELAHHLQKFAEAPGGDTYFRIVIRRAVRDVFTLEIATKQTTTAHRFRPLALAFGAMILHALCTH